MLTPIEIDQILKLIRSTSERKAAITLGISLHALQRTVPLDVPPETESKIRSALSTLNPVAEPVVKPSKLQAQLTLLERREELRRQREAERAEAKRLERLERERLRAERDTRRREEQELARAKRRLEKQERRFLIYGK